MGNPLACQCWDWAGTFAARLVGGGGYKVVMSSWMLPMARLGDTWLNERTVAERLIVALKMPLN